MKNYILLTSLGAAGLATVFGIWAVRLYQLASISGLFSIASFFVGLAYPSTSTIVTSLDQVNQTETRKVVNN